MKFGPKSRDSTPQSPPRERARTPRVLLLDDSKTMLDVLHIHLMGLGFDLVSASSPAEALAEVRRRPPDLVITDLNMPEMSGLDFCRQMWATRAAASVPVIVVSSKLSEDVRAQAQALGVRTCLAKPLRPNLLVAAVNRALDSV